MSHDGYRYTNQDLSNYIRDLDSGASRTMLRNKPSSTIKPTTVVVLCIEAFQKKQEFGGGYAAINSLNCDGELINDKHSTLKIK